MSVCWGGGWRPSRARAEKNAMQPGPGDKLTTGTQVPGPGHNNPVECERSGWTRKSGARARKWARAFPPALRWFPHFSRPRRGAGSSARLVRLPRPGGGRSRASAEAAGASPPPTVARDSSQRSGSRP